MTRSPSLRLTSARALAVVASVAASLLVVDGPARAGTTTAPGDSFGAPIAAEGRTGEIFTSNTGATGQNGEPSHSTSPSGVADPADRSIWFRWKSPVTGQVTFRTNGSAIDTVMAAYTGSDLKALTRIATNDDTTMPLPDGSSSTVQSAITFGATKGTTYRIVVDSFTGSLSPVPTGAIDLSWDANDDFAAAVPLANPAEGFLDVFGQNLGASRQPGEPLHAGQSGDRSLWYQWTAPKTGEVTFNTSGSRIDTLLAAYTGSSVSSLKLIASNDDQLPERTSQLVFGVTAGKTYKIAVDGFHGAEGPIHLAYGYPIRQP